MRRSYLLIALIALLALPGVAGASTVRTINFDDASGDVGDSYYDNGALDGVRFGGQFIRTASPYAASAPNLVSLPGDGGPKIRPRAYLNTNAGLDFPYTHVRVAMYAGGYLDGALPKAKLTVTALDVNGNTLDTTEVPPPAAPGVDRAISVTDLSGQIAHVSFTSDDTGWAIDNFSFDVPDSPPPPDFGVSWPDRIAGEVFVPPGETRDVKLNMVRVNASSGPVAFAAQGLPAGVTAQFVPNPVDEPTTSSTVTMRLTAAANAPAVRKQPVTATGTPAATAGSATHSVTVPVSVPAQYDLRARGLEITQGVQIDGANGGLPQQDLGPGVASYRGVRLVSGAQTSTVVRLYADAAGAPAGGALATAELSGTDSAGRPLPGGPLHPVAGSFLQDLGYGAGAVTRTERLDDVHPIDFMLPPTWTHIGTISLHAHVKQLVSYTGAPTSQECVGCDANNDTELRDISFISPAVITLTPLKFTYEDRTVPTRPTVAMSGPSDAPFQAFQQISPVVVHVEPWAGEINVTNRKVFKGFKGWVTRTFIQSTDLDRSDKDSEVLSRIEDWRDDRPTAYWTIAVAPSDVTQFDGNTYTVGVSRGSLYDDRVVGEVQVKRPLTSVAHELGHGLSRLHASAGCGGGANGQKAQSWPDPNGTIQGVGLDVTQRGAAGGPFRILATEGPVYDYMSYCATDGGGAWLSGKGWTDMLDRYNNGPRAARLLPRRVRTLAAVRRGVLVRGGLGADGTAHLAEVEAGAVHPPQSGDEQPGVTLRATDAQGKVVASAPLLVHHDHADTGGTPTPVTTFEGFVPAAGAASVQVVQNGNVLARRDRSAHAPKVRFLSPRRGTKIGRAKTVAVRWKATDADGTPVDVSVDYSSDGGRTFRTVYMGSSTGKISLSRTYFSRSQRARLRIVADDGFNRSQAVSGPLISLGTPPDVRISAPAPGSVSAQNAPLAPIGYAFDDSGAALKGKRLTWKVGDQVLGHGEAIAATGLPAGAQRLRLEAKDRFGRVGAASVRIRLTPVQPFFKSVKAPKRVSRKARRVTLTVSTTVGATLRVGRQRFAVGTRARKVNVNVKPGRSLLALKLKLSSGPFTASRTVKIAR